MGDATYSLTSLLVAYSAYALGTASPGPSNLAVMATAMHAGRRPALMLALGVVSGSTVWGLLAAFGLSAAMARYGYALAIMKIVGGVYLLWLAFKSARSAWQPSAPMALAANGHTERYAALFLRGAAMHLTNPKAIVVWLSIVALAVPAQASTSQALLVVAGCVPIGLAVFCGYAVVFSLSAARRAYLRARRGFEAALALMFGYAGLRLLLSKT